MAALRWAVLVFFWVAGAGIAQQSTTLTPSDNRSQSQAPDRNQPGLSHRPLPTPDAAQGKIKLDVLVTDAAGHPVSGLQKSDFTLLDIQKPRPILSFQAFDASAQNAATASSDPPVEVILLIDMANISLQRAAYERYQLTNFLRQNGGHLTQPVTLMIFSDQGVKVQPRPSRDGNVLAKMVEQSESSVHTIPLSRGYDAMDRLSLSLKTLRQIVSLEGTKPGRKMLLWIGPGWPMLESPGYHLSSGSSQNLFNSIVEISTALRDARVTLYSVYPRDPESMDQLRADAYKGYLKGIASSKQVDPGDVALPVFAVHSGGLALSAAGDLVREINTCIAEATAYYTLSFDPARADHVDEYHELKLEVDKPDLKARTNTGYYAQPLPRP